MKIGGIKLARRRAIGQRAWPLQGYAVDAPAADTPARSGLRPQNTTVFGVILAISFCHLLNDMMQSLLPAIYPNLKARLRPELRPDRPGHAGLPDHRLAAAAAGRALCRQAADAAGAAGRHAVHAGRPAVLSVAHTYRGAAGRRVLLGIGSSVFHPESSRVARMAVGRPPRPGAVAVPGRRQCRPGARSAGRGADRGALGPVEPGASSRCWRCCPARSCGTSASGTSTTAWRA